MKTIQSLTMSAIMLLILMTGSASALTITEGYTPVDADAAYGVRYRHFAGTPNTKEVYLGIPDLGVAGNRVEQSISWNSPNSYFFMFSLNYLFDTLNSRVDGFPSLQYFADEILAPHTLQITVANRDSGGSVWLSDVMVNGVVAGTGEFGGGIWKDWMLTDLSAEDGLTVSGNINLDQVFDPNKEEHTKIEIKAYANAPVVTPEPSTFILLGLGLVGLAVLGRRRMA